MEIYKITGILLSAGKSERMGEMKALLPLGDKLVIERLIEEYLASPIDELIVVVGFNGEKLSSVIESLFPSANIKIVFNEDYEKGMYSSVVKGVTNSTYNSILLGLVDNPLIDRKIISKIIKEYDFENIIIPSYNKKGGHPVLFPKFVKDEILNKPYNNLKEVFEKFRDKIKYVDAPYEVVMDMDTKEDYEKILNHFLGGEL